MMNWQSMRSVMPPCPGMESPKSLSLKLRLSPEAKNPPKGAINEANEARTKVWIWIGANVNDRLASFGGRKNSSGMWYVRAMKTGFGSHSRPVKTVAPRS